METIKTASFEYLIGLSKEKPGGGYTFVLDGCSYEIDDVLENSPLRILTKYLVLGGFEIKKDE